MTGEEEHELRHAPGPVRLYSTTKYNHDILPTGRVMADTCTPNPPNVGFTRRLERRRNNLKHIKDFYLEAKARIWL